MQIFLHDTPQNTCETHLESVRLQKFNGFLLTELHILENRIFNHSHYIFNHLHFEFDHCREYKHITLIFCKYWID